MMNTAQAYIENIIHHLEPHSNQVLAEGMSKYMRYLFPFLGIKKPLRATITKNFFKQYGMPEKQYWKEVVRELFELEEREYHYIAMEICEKMKKHWKEDTIHLLEWMIINKSWWDSVDLIASKLIGHYFKTFPHQKEQITSEWNADENMWLRRSSIIFQLSYKANTDQDLLFKYCLQCIHEKEFFIRKAIGWSLRQYARINTTAVMVFVKQNPFSPLTKREALKHLQ